jgi:prenyltransferase beta subunit
LRLEMLQVARLSPKLLGDSRDLILAFLDRAQDSGAFHDRSGNRDLYYTVFGLECLRALSADLPTGTADYLHGFGAGDDLDLVHLCCLIRCWANVERSVPRVGEFKARLDRFGPTSTSTAYTCFLALGAYQDLRVDPPSPGELLASIDALRAVDGAFANQPGAPTGQTSATAAAVGLLRHFDQPIPPDLSGWLLARQHASGGFFAAPSAPIPDLLSTATALHTLSSLRVPIEPIQESTLDFLDTLWTTRGGFIGSWADDVLDCEYTYYGLLGLGHLTL